MQAYPLQWPEGRPRTQYPARARFHTISMDAATKILLAEIRRQSGSNPVISTNVELRRDGLPYSNRRVPSDQGVAVYYTHRNKQMCFACDRWDNVEHNIYAIAKTIEALRGIGRWGSGNMVEQAFTGFLALPAPKDPATILELPSGKIHTYAEIEDAYYRAAKYSHPDRGGSHEKMSDINWARDVLRQRCIDGRKEN